VTLECGSEVTQDHLKMVPFESLGAVFYSSSTITMALSIVSFARYSDLLVENGEFFYTSPVFSAPDRGNPSEFREVD